MSSVLTNILVHRELLYMLVLRNLKIRYKNSALGFFWTLLGPLFLIVIYAIFLGLLKVATPLPVLVSGIIVWQFPAMCLGDALHAVVGNANLVTKAAFPRIILPISMVGANFVNFLLSCIVLLAYLLVVGTHFGAVLLLPVALLSQVALCVGLALLLSAANVFFRDTEHILSVLMLAWFFMSPVIYDVSLVLEKFPEWVHRLFFLNPMAGIVTLYRMALLSAPNPGTGLLAPAIVLAWAVFGVGVVVFQKVEPRFGDEL